MGATDHEPHPHAEPGSDISDQALRIYAIRDLLIERGVLTQAEIDRTIHAVESTTPATGAAIVARAWVDPEFKARLLADADAAVAELGITSSGAVDYRLVAVENTDDVRNLVVCTLCSCYPRSVLGRPPDWYKSASYRARAVSEPRRVLEEFGTPVDDDVQVRVLDSTADVRYLVIPQRPAGTDELDEAELAQLLHRDCLIGVRDPAPEVV